MKAFDFPGSVFLDQFIVHSHDRALIITNAAHYVARSSSVGISQRFLRRWAPVRIRHARRRLMPTELERAT